MAGMYEKHAAVIHRDGLTPSELLVIQELDTLANSLSGEFIRKSGGAIVNATLTEIIALTGLSDVLISTPSNGQVLLYNGSSWVNSTGIAVFTSNNLSVFSLTTSAQLAGIISDETGTGSLVFATSPTLVTPLLGTPTSGVLTNCTGLPAASVLAGSLGAGAYVISTTLTVPTIIGGTGTTSDLNLQTTSGVGATGADMHFLVGNNGATEAITILNSGNVGIGTTGPAGLLDIESNSLGNIVNNQDGAGGAVQIVGVHSSDVNGSLLTLRKSRGTAASPTLVSNGDTIGIINFQAYQGSDYGSTAAISASVDGTYSSGQRPASRLSFYTNLTNSGQAEQVRIDSSGNVGVGTTGPNTNLDVNGFIEWSGQSRVSTQFDKTSDTALAAITGLTSTLVAGKTYTFRVVLHITAGAVGGEVVDLGGGTVTATTLISQVNVLANTTNVFAETSRQTSLTGASAGVAGDTSYFIVIEGLITVNAGGTFKPRIAQKVSNGTATSVLVGSYMEINQFN